MKLVIWVVFSILVHLSLGDNEDQVAYYRKLIADQIEASNKYKYRTNASEFEATQTNGTCDLGSFDFIVVGGGTTGSVLASRLSEKKKWRILLLEAGGPGNATTEMPCLSDYTLLTDYNWGFRTVPQRNACLDMPNSQCDFARGQGLGGSSLLNRMVFTRGNRRDYDKWELQGNPGWSYNKVLPYFKKLENFSQSDQNTVVDWRYHGRRGKLSIEQFTPIDALTRGWLEANEEIGLRTVDYNGRVQSGAAIFQKNTKQGRRADLGTAFLNPINGRPNLTILLRAYATKIIIENKKATGVEFTHKGQVCTATASKEVILSAGALHSPQLLMLSGIGPRNHLQEVGIDTIVDLEVGSNLGDHPIFSALQFDTNFTAETFEYYIGQYLDGVGPLAAANMFGGINFYSDPATFDYPNIELVLFGSINFSKLLNRTFGPPLERSWQNLKSGPLSMTLYALHSKSSGTVRLKSNNPFDYPLLDPRLLSDPRNEDIDTLYKGIKLALRLIRTKGLARFNVTLTRQDIPACRSTKYLSKDYWYCMLKQFTRLGLHAVGTCRMGPNPKNGDVVDARNRVYGIRNLRVVDASVIPVSLSAHINAVCAMIGEKVSDMLKREYVFVN